nr:MAG TPA: hypothetical protein [Caudoviricetes sp.]
MLLPVSAKVSFDSAVEKGHFSGGIYGLLAAS